LCIYVNLCIHKYINKLISATPLEKGFHLWSSINRDLKFAEMGPHNSKKHIFCFDEITEDNIKNVYSQIERCGIKKTWPELPSPVIENISSKLNPLNFQKFYLFASALLSSKSSLFIFECMDVKEIVALMCRIQLKLYFNCECSYDRLADYVYRTLDTQGDWYNDNKFILKMKEDIFSSLFGCFKGSFPVIKNKSKVLEFQDIYLLSYLTNPQSWTLLYTTGTNRSWTSLTDNIISQSKTILVVRCDKGRIFGGYSNDCWFLKPVFYGSSSNFLFKLVDQIDIYNSAKYNQNYQV
jgi:hypothetical protein